MKLKPAISLLFLTSLMLTSCKSDYSCNCRVIYDDMTPPDTSYVVKLIPGVSERKAQETCDQQASDLHLGNGVYVNCELEEL